MKKIIAGLLIVTSLTAPVSASSGALMWNAMTVSETTKTAVAPKKQEQLTNLPLTSDALTSIINTMHQQQKQTMDAMLAIMNQNNQKNNEPNGLMQLLQQQQQQQQAIVAAMMQQQQQQQEFFKLILQMQKQNNNAQAAVSTQQETNNVRLKTPQEIAQPAVIQAVAPVEPEVIAEAAPAADMTFIPYERKRLAPPDEPVIIKTVSERIEGSVQDAALEGYYRDSMAVFNYTDTALYKIYCKVGYITVVRLQPGETFINAAGGDSHNWQIDYILAGNQGQLIIKPMAANVETNFVLLTNKHSYQIQAKSTSWYNPIVSWTYPEELREQSLRIAQAERKEKKETISVAPYNLNTSYKVEARGMAKPKMIFDDGKKVYIQLTESMQAELPALVLRDGSKRLIVNYQVKNGYYIVNRLFDEAELLLGSKNYIRIKRVKASQEGLEDDAA